MKRTDSHWPLASRMLTAACALVLTWPLLTGCKQTQASAPTPPAARKETAATRPAPAVLTVDIRRFTPEQRLAALCVEGIANRQGPRVYLDTGGSVRWMQWGFEPADKNNNWDPAVAAQVKSKYDSICDAWMDTLTQRAGLRFSRVGMEDLLAQSQGTIKGVILYNKLNDDLAIAATMAGLKDAVPMTPELYEQWVKSTGLQLPVIFDVRTLYAGYPAGADKRLEAHRWAIVNLLPACDRHGALSRDRTYNLDLHDTLIDVDLAVRNRWMTFQLNYQSAETRNKTDKPHPVYGFDHPDKPVLVDLLNRIEPFSPIYGWGSPDENNLVRRLTLHRLFKVCTGTGNSSFYQHLPLMKADFHQPHQEKVTLDPTKFYLTFMSNEGDTLKYLAHFANGGTWLQPERGTLPINWGMNPMLYREFPGLVSYYYATATPQDYFFSATSGWGYTHPERLADDSILPYAALVKKGGEIADLRYVDIWWAGGLRERKQYYPFLHATGMRGLTQWSGHQGVEFAPDGMPIVHSNLYYKTKDLPAMLAMLQRELKEVPPPWFVVIYGGTPHQFAQIMQGLPAEKVKAVKLDEFFEAARLARPKVEGRTWNPTAQPKVEAAPGAGEGQGG